MTLNPDQQKQVMQMAANQMFQHMLDNIGAGNNSLLPIGLVSRFTGWQPAWIRRNLTIIQNEGCQAQVRYGEVIEHIEAGTVKKTRN